MVQQGVAVPMFYIVRQIATRSMPHQLQKDVAATSGIILRFYQVSNLYKVLMFVYAHLNVPYEGSRL